MFFLLFSGLFYINDTDWFRSWWNRRSKLTYRKYANKHHSVRYVCSNKKLSYRKDSRSFKVTDFSTNRKPVCDFLLVNNTNLYIIYILSGTVRQISRSIDQIIAFDMAVHIFNEFVLRNLCEYSHKSYITTRNSSGDEIANVNFLRRHRARTTKYNRLVHKFRHKSTRLCVGMLHLFTKFSEITQYNGHYVVQGHSRSPILVPIESSYRYTTSY